ncbi:MAG: methyltransferase domain-containing protein [Candidatus Aenigmarchaeota archaeon]|nr:methyltransferase domain-containing protein [Candidatus Aenigmarchaeota archaeon]
MVSKKFKKGEKVLILSQGKKWVVKLEGKQFVTQYGRLNLDEVIGKEEGYTTEVNGKVFYFFRPTISEFLTKIKRKTQIIYPKDLSVMMFLSGVKDDDVIIEAGTGSGSLLISLLNTVKKGKVISIERKKEVQEVALKNIKNYFGRIPKNLKLINSDVYEKISLRIKNADKIFLDLTEPWRAVHIIDYLRPGGILVVYNPQITQIQKMVESIKDDFVDVQVFEILKRNWIVDGKRVRPEDLMRGHAGFVMIARKIT